MKVLLCHDYYQQRGGEDESYAAEAALLESWGHRVVRFTVHNDTIGAQNRLALAARTIWNGRLLHELRALIRDERPDVMHCTNLFPLLSPAACYAAKRERIPVVQALRNFRLGCPNALLFREGRVCEICLRKAVPWPAVGHACYRSSRAASATVAAMLSVHRAIGTWRRAVNVFFTASEFARAKLIECGIPATRILTKPNFVHPDPAPRSGSGGYVAFVGRLSPEKGLRTLIDAWKSIGDGVALKIVGDGPERQLVSGASSRDPRIQWVGRRSREEVFDLVGDAACVVVPSVSYETFGSTVIEAFAVGTPVVASRLGALAEIVDNGRTGLHFEAGDAVDLAMKIRTMLSDARRLSEMRQAARREYEHRYTAERNYRTLMDIYRRAVAMAATAGVGA